jgi:hypothetical protein
MNEMLNYDEAAAFLRCSPSHLRKLVMLRQVPHLKPFGPNGRVFFLKADLEEFLQVSRRPVER